MPNLIGARVLIDEASVGADVPQDVGVGAAARVDSDRAWIRVLVVPPVFQRLPAAFEEDAVLRVDELGFPGQITEKSASK
jgi:hypothetical protein